MKLIISDKVKKDLFVAIFQIIKNCTNTLLIMFEDNRLFIQGMDKSHVCLFETSILNEWFDHFEKKTVDSKEIYLDPVVFHTIISTKHDSCSINIHFEGEPDSLHIDLISTESKGDFNKFFKLPLINGEYQVMDIPDTEYDAEFSINSKKICEICSQMLLFGNDLNIKCFEDKIDLLTNGISGEMLVTIPIDDLSEYSIVEGDIIDLKYSLSYMHKMCLTNKLSSEIQFFVSKDLPLKIKYDLGNNSSVAFFIAPKLDD